MNYAKDTEKIAEKIAEQSVRIASKNSNKYVYWVNDYPLASVVRHIRNLDKSAQIVFSLRTPFRVNENNNNTPQGVIKFMENILCADVITVHRMADMKSFVDMFRKQKLGEVVSEKNKVILISRFGVTQIKVVPMGSSYKYRRSLTKHADTKRVYENCLEMSRRRKIIAGISRFEKTKGLEFELDAFEALLMKRPDLAKRIQFIRFSYISKEKMMTEAYVTYRKVIDDKIKRINDKFGTDDWRPILPFLDKKLSDTEVSGVLMASDVLFIGSIADGFNHIAMEAIFSHSILKPIQIIIGDIGAADYIHGGYRFRPNSINSAVIALENAIDEKGLRKILNMNKLRRARYYSIDRWTMDVLYTLSEVKNNKIYDNRKAYI